MKTRLIYKVEGEQIGDPVESESIPLGIVEVNDQKFAVDRVEQPATTSPDPNYVPVTVVHCKRD